MFRFGCEWAVFRGHRDLRPTLLPWSTSDHWAAWLATAVLPRAPVSTQQRRKKDYILRSRIVCKPADSLAGFFLTNWGKRARLLLIRFLKSLAGFPG